MEKPSSKVGLKAENIFLHTSINISVNFDIKHLWWSKADLFKETKKILRKDTVGISEAVGGRYSVKTKKGILKNFATCLFAHQ